MDDQTFERRKKVIYDFICDDSYVPMRIRDIAAVLQIPKDQREDLRLVLNALKEEGKITLSKRGKYSRSPREQRKGIFQASAKGYGFVRQEGEEDDVFIPEGGTMNAFQGDEVLFIITRDKGKDRSGRKLMEGRIVQILSHCVIQVVGRYEQKNSYGFVIPDNQKIQTDIYVPSGREHGAVTGSKVVLELSSYGDDRHKPEGVVTEVLGQDDEPGVDILSIVREYDLPDVFSERVLSQAKRVEKDVNPTDMAERKDLRSLQTVTIDSEDAKDLDDAISLTKEGDRYQLGVHIADVTHYVEENSALDREALKRGTSVYLADRVLPMLPPALSNGCCSLNEGEDRLTLSCLMTVDQEGKVTDHEIVASVIRVDRRMSYSTVARILEEQNPEDCEAYAAFVPLFERMKELSQILRKSRQMRGGIDFDLPETKLVLDEKGKPTEIKPGENDIATQIIEDFMLLANETVAKDFEQRGVPFVYRTHETPDEDKMKALSLLIQPFGFHLRMGKEIQPKEIQELLFQVQGSPQENLITDLTLRSMKQARYTTENIGHFGLAAACYTHFTSPIRRYPDLQIHRIIKESLKGDLSAERAGHYAEILPEVVSHANETERRADDAEREAIRLKKAEYMEDFIGQEFDGVISGVTNWGAYVELPNTVEGLVSVTRMTDDRYQFDEDRYELIGQRTRKGYRLGQPVRIKVISVDLKGRNVDFEWA